MKTQTPFKRRRICYFVVFLLSGGVRSFLHRGAVQRGRIAGEELKIPGVNFDRLSRRRSRKLPSQRCRNRPPFEISVH
jgi:hypothetical protein